MTKRSFFLIMIIAIAAFFVGFMLSERVANPYGIASKEDYINVLRFSFQTAWGFITSGASIFISIAAKNHLENRWSL